MNDRTIAFVRAFAGPGAMANFLACWRHSKIFFRDDCVNGAFLRRLRLSRTVAPGNAFLYKRSDSRTQDDR